MVVVMALAGGLGAVVRFVVDTSVARRTHRRAPLGTMVVNISGSFLLGLITALALSHAGPHDLTVVAGTGFLGGYTTFSAASVETVNLARTGGWRAGLRAARHAVVMLVAALAAAALGLWLGRVS